VVERVAEIGMTFFYCSGEREVTVVRIQYFSFGLRGEAMGRSVAVI
jgi:hypothetical protein